MSDIAIQFDHVGKLYHLGLVGTGTLSHDLNRWWQTKILHREDPYLKIGETNDRAHKGNSDFVWALRDVSFDVKQGEVVGIIGKNGAGKSTLLKILSRVTSPTTGEIRARGRIASLLEVGTGFHGEMTGRENIYMNGAIMGMTRAEVTRKLDEIIDFAGVERYIDTPVKRYSSGMTVRLGFAVAAFLEPEILVVDEVLAVGDAEFQRKSIGKMQDVAREEGRTVLFVSHNMAAVRRLCQRGILLKNGEVAFDGSVDACIDRYMETSITALRSFSAKENLVRRGGDVPTNFEIIGVRMLNDANSVSSSDVLEFEIDFSRLSKSTTVCQFGIVARNEADALVWACYTQEVNLSDKGSSFTGRIIIRNHNTPKGRYNLTFNISRYDYSSSIRNYDIVRDAVSFEVNFKNSEHSIPFNSWPFNGGCALQDSQVIVKEVHS